MKTRELLSTLCDVCDDQEVPIEWFNLGLHEASLEIYTAPEHDDHDYHGDMGAEVRHRTDLTTFIKSVKVQNQYYKRKEV